MDKPNTSHVFSWGPRTYLRTGVISTSIWGIIPHRKSDGFFPVWEWSFCPHDLMIFWTSVHLYNSPNAIIRSKKNHDLPTDSCWLGHPKVVKDVQDFSGTISINSCCIPAWEMGWWSPNRSYRLICFKRVETHRLDMTEHSSYFFPDSLGILSFSSSFEAASSPTSVKFHLRSLGTTVPREGSVDPRLHCWNSFVETPGFQGRNMFFLFSCWCQVYVSVSPWLGRKIPIYMF